MPRIPSLAVLALMAPLAACAGTGPAPAPVDKSALIGRYTPGIVLAIRPVSLTPATPALVAVLTALGQPAPAAIPAAREILIRRPDNSTAAIIQPAAQHFAPGQAVAIVEAAGTVLRTQ